MLIFGHENVWARTLIKIEVAAVFGDADNLPNPGLRQGGSIVFGCLEQEGKP